jgi:hypothetical protein
MKTTITATVKDDADAAVLCVSFPIELVNA